MMLQEPIVEFVRIDTELVAESSITCDTDTQYNCTDTYIQSSWEGCGCSDGKNDSLVPCDGLV